MSQFITNIHPVGNQSVQVTLPDGTSIHSTHIGLLPNQDLPYKARIVHLFPELKKILISLGQLCDSGMKVILTKEKNISY